MQVTGNGLDNKHSLKRGIHIGMGFDLYRFRYFSCSQQLKRGIYINMGGYDFVTFSQVRQASLLKRESYIGMNLSKRKAV
ncbi:MAG: hypothetical protein BA863_07490 [Desulfovibrio sp. S3730MH75]|nr:MAG: hypothetical protein BA863_07490 [Desulfovibrio sp. S3730MH75]